MSYFGSDAYWFWCVVIAAILLLVTIALFANYINDRVNDRYADTRKQMAQWSLVSLLAFFTIPLVWFLALPVAAVCLVIWLVRYAAQDAFEKEEV